MPCKETILMLADQLGSKDFWYIKKGFMITYSIKVFLAFLQLLGGPNLLSLGVKLLELLKS